MNRKQLGAEYDQAIERTNEIAQSLPDATNAPDTLYEAVLRGDRTALDALLAKIRTGAIVEATNEVD